MNALPSDTLYGTYNTTPLTLSLIPGVWLCSYVLRVLSNAFNANVTFANAYISGALNIANVSTSVVGYTAYNFSPGSVTIGIIGTNNLSLCGSGVITSQTTQTVTLTIGIGSSGTTILNGQQTYIQATRIG